MIPVTTIYDGATAMLLKEANGEMSYELFNILSPLVETDLVDWITGDITGIAPPAMYSNQKDRDFISNFITKFSASAVNGKIKRPDDYYLFDDINLLGNYGELQPDCENEVEYLAVTECNTSISLLDADQFTARCNTYIKGLKPSFKKPIVKQVGIDFEFMPKDIGSVELTYIRYPKFAKIVTVFNNTYGVEEIDVANSLNYEWDFKAAPLLIWFLVDRFSNRTSNQAQKQFNQASGINTHK